MGAELKRVDENTDDQFIMSGPKTGGMFGGFDEAYMAGVQRAHGGQERDAASFGAPGEGAGLHITGCGDDLHRLIWGYGICWENAPSGRPG